MGFVACKGGHSCTLLQVLDRRCTHRSVHIALQGDGHSRMVRHLRLWMSNFRLKFRPQIPYQVHAPPEPLTGLSKGNQQLNVATYMQYSWTCGHTLYMYVARILYLFLNKFSITVSLIGFHAGAYVLRSKSCLHWLIQSCSTPSGTWARYCTFWTISIINTRQLKHWLKHGKELTRERPSPNHLH